MQAKKTTQIETSNLRPLLTLSAVQERNADLLFQIAKQKGTTLALRELLDLISIDAQEDDLASAWNRSNFLSAKYRIVLGLIHEKDNDSFSEGEIQNRYSRARSNLNFAKEFSRIFQKESDLSLLSVSGSTSYMSASSEDDLDFFCVTKHDSLWIFLSKALLQRRLFQKREKNSPSLCFSFVIDEEYAHDLFSTKLDRLFARDAIMAVVLKGGDFYEKLLEESVWISSHFPKMYLARISNLQKENKSSIGITCKPEKFATLKKILNDFLFYSLGTYIRIKSNAFNKRLRMSGNAQKIFRAKIERGKCIFESNDYLALRKKYAALKES
jgi:hypothetical protein